MTSDDRKKRVLEHLQLSSEIIKPKQSKINRQVPQATVFTNPEPEESLSNPEIEETAEAQIEALTEDIPQTPAPKIIETPKPPKTIPTRKTTKADKKSKIMAHLKSSSEFDPASAKSQEQKRKQKIQEHLRQSF